MNIDFQNSKVGDGATMCGYSDNHACTIIAISEKRITVQVDHAKILNGSNSGELDALHFSFGGFSGHTSGVQRWETSPNTNGGKATYSLRKWNDHNGDPTYRWAPVGRKRHEGSSLIEGRHHHYDYNF